MEEKLVEVLDSMIVNKAKLGVQYKDIVKATGLSTSTITNILNPSRRMSVNLDSILRLIRYFEELKNMKTEDK